MEDKRYPVEVRGDDLQRLTTPSHEGGEYYYIHMVKED